MSKFHTLRLILGDQLNANHSWFKQTDSGVLYLIAELHSEANYVKHHIQKVTAFFLAMQGFADALQQAGHQVCHLTLDDTKGLSLTELLTQQAEKIGAQTIQLQRPDEYRLLNQLESFQSTTTLNIEWFDTEHFLLPFEDIPKHFKAKHSVRMEHFYRKMRQRFDVLMTAEGQPEGGKWNYDANNRNKLKKQDLADIPQPLCFQHPVDEIVARLHQHQVPCFGQIGSHLSWPVTRREAHQLLDYFCQHLLANFGRFQDAMTDQSEHAWSLYHSRLSFALNSKLIHPMTVIQAAVAQFRQDPQ